MQSLLKAGDIHPVLVDVGASGGAPAIWKSIAASSIYVGFDPDLRDARDSFGGEFYRRVVLNKAVTSDSGNTEVEFYLTAYPHCSSTLPPDVRSLQNYAFQEYFVTVGSVRVPAVTLNSAVKQLNLNRIDWLKSDTQGTDLRLFTSLEEPLRSRVLALDVEPGLIDAYQGEDLFVDAHRYLTANGFWLSNLNVLGVARIRQSTLTELVPNAALRQAFAHRVLKKSPGWCEARYLRTLDWLANNRGERRDYVLLWIFSVLDNQPAFALDVALEYERAFGADSFLEIMKKRPLAALRFPWRYRFAANLKTLVSGRAS